MPQPSKHWPIPRSRSGFRSSVSTWRRASSRRPKASPRSRRPKLQSGGRSLKRRVSARRPSNRRDEGFRMRMAGKTVLITGSTDGVGRYVAAKLAAVGAKVLIHGRDQERARTLADQIKREGYAEPIFYQ